MYALNPAGRLSSVNDTKALSNAKNIEKALNSYIVDNNGLFPPSITYLQYGYNDICKTTASGCINLYEYLVPKYLMNLPIDETYCTQDTIGYKLKYDASKGETLVKTYREYREWAEANGKTLTEGLVGYWKMDEASWNGTAGEVKDSSGNGNHGVASGGVTTGIGKFGSSGSFDGVDDAVITLLNIDQTATSQGATYSVWVYPTSNSSGRHHVISSDNTGYDWSLLREGGYWYIFTGENSRSTISSVDLNVWQHLVAVFIPEYGIKFYKNGVNVSNIPFIDYDTSDGNIGIGKNPGFPEYFPGSIDEVRVYDRILSMNEVNALYATGAPPVAYWKFDETSGAIAADSSGNGNTGTLTNGPNWDTGKYGNAISFDGVNDYITLGKALLETSNTNHQITFTAWVKPNVVIADDWIISQYNLGANRFTWGVTSNKIRYFLGGTSIVSNTNIMVGQWQFLATTKNSNGVITHYLNGIFDGSGILSGVYENTNTIIGGEDVYPDYSFNGLVDDVRIYNYARTPEQIQKDMNNF